MLVAAGLVIAARRRRANSLLLAAPIAVALPLAVLRVARVRCTDRVGRSARGNGTGQPCHGLTAGCHAGAERFAGRWAMIFTDRVDAGRRLAGCLAHLRGRDIVVLALPRGGVPVAFEVAEALHAPLDVIIVRKLGLPDHAELGMGAIGEGGARIVNREVMRLARVDATQLAAVETRERAVLAQRARLLRGGRPPTALTGRTAVIVDDGVATGSTALAACEEARARGATHIVLAVPVASPDVIQWLRSAADEVVSVLTPEWLVSVGQWYDDFTPTTDRQVVDLLDRARRGRTASPAAT